MEASVAYALFLHRQELRRRQMLYVKVSKTKILLTKELIAEQRQRLANCSPEDLQILNRETQFKRQLQQKLKHRSKQLKAIAKQKERRG
uniref:Uncharacterized protein n=1 Tax=Drosophila melanogaster TaxID=7227 RepID=A8JNL0_DROME|nr:uncharacterized protein Dmel_CG34266 [Drosophila melanogaster]ABW08466.1 uncharacterized protein Dmel_CG34266 [Drosophila melanogaster]|eukprot:NP_001097507.1 uncharacterized protein Dmel_CG34266 [Drosophila melanogaster]